MSEHKDIDDLYGSFDTSVNALKKQVDRLEYNELKQENQRLRVEAAQLQNLNKELGERNEILEKNISILFATAQTELKRKDREIQRLRQELNAELKK